MYISDYSMAPRAHAQRGQKMGDIKNFIHQQQFHYVDTFFELFSDPISGQYILKKREGL